MVLTSAEGGHSVLQRGQELRCPALLVQLCLQLDLVVPYSRQAQIGVLAPLVADSRLTEEASCVPQLMLRCLECLQVELGALYRLWEGLQTYPALHLDSDFSIKFRIQILLGLDRVVLDAR